MKKGATHVDWAISMGIFLVYVMLMLIFLRPASQPTYSGNTLLDTIYSGLKDDTTYTVQRGYLIITPTNLDNIPHDSEGRYNIRIKGASKYLITEWRDSEKQWEDGSQPSTHLTMFNESLGKVPSSDLKDAIAFDFKNEYCKPYGTNDCADSDKDVLDITAKLKNNEPNIFWFVYSEGATYSHHLADISYTDVQCQEKDPPPPEKRKWNCLLNYCNDPTCPDYIKNDFIYEFGVVETYTGFSDAKLDTLKINYPESTKYNDLKKAWGFPEDKNFKIKIEGV